MGIWCTVTSAPLEPLTLVADGAALTGLHSDGHLRAPRLAGLVPRADDDSDAAVRQLGGYFEGIRHDLGRDIAPRGSELEEKTWVLLKAIRYGDTRTYRQLAPELSDPGAARPVGKADGWNPVSNHHTGPP